MLKFLDPRLCCWEDPFPLNCWKNTTYIQPTYPDSNQITRIRPKYPDPPLRGSPRPGAEQVVRHEARQVAPTISALMGVRLMEPPAQFHGCYIRRGWLETPAPVCMTVTNK